MPDHGKFPPVRSVPRHLPKRPDVIFSSGSAVAGFTDASRASAERRWGVILAGGDGVRLRRLTRFVCGDDRPKQFCPLLGESTLLEEARQRAERSIPSDQILFAVTRAHQDYYLRYIGGQPSQRIVQPSNKGTAPAILYTLLHIAQLDPDAIVAVLPSDHYYSRECAFTAALDSAFALADASPTSVVLLGAQPKGPEVQYGWIEVGAALPGMPRAAFHVKGFQEKPHLSIARRLLKSGSLWNTFVMVGHVQGLLELAAVSLPGLLEVLRSALTRSHRGRETRIADRLYEQIAPTDFSRQILSPGAHRLVTLRLEDPGWNDLGDPERVLCTLLERKGAIPAWSRRWQAAKRAERMSPRCLTLAVA